ncbi:tetratricopeptide repeat protein [Lacinutrix sp. C3R15]|uniref:tetratricopeptide repeat protein n=1 Tax=Flavobacteriaceae TaxID=49546 RepID=UPI001C0A3EC5|nr:MULTISPECIES: tetratricopeptide repeat protein [Flavobacteriaceae]MBU2940145.1 tetratricopeptide repeat protein [Lacinutrix sp. C3R15]MDO6623462.1 tetratricopeptide repeat protein [Oceanihabitans sp. 1_MG-2023]
MKKQVIVALALAFSVFTFAQKKELKTVEKAVKNNDFSVAKSLLEQLDPMLSGMEDKYKDKYYFLKGQAFYANGAGSDEDIDLAIENFDNVKDSYKVEIGEIKQNLINTLLTDSNEQYQSAQYLDAVKGFEKLYKLIPSDTTYLYYAASSAITGKDYDSAIKNYEKLLELGYTGIEKQYVATNVETGEVEAFSKSQRDLFVKAGSHIKPSERVSESKTAEIVKNLAFIYLNNGESEKALAAVQEARKMDPTDSNLILSEANLQYKNGNKETYKKLIEEAIQLDPENTDLIFNLGVVASENGEIEKAKEYYDKVISLEPKNVNALTNMAALILGQENALIDEMNGLGTSNADNIRYDELKEKRTGLYESAIPYLEAVIEVEPNNSQVAKTLLNIYGAIGETEKLNAIKALLDSIEN